jgi:hypothetical protein
MKLTVVSSPQCAGEITSDPHHADWSFEGTDNVSLHAAANPGYEFVNWTGDIGGVTDTAQDTIIVEMSRYYPGKQKLQITAKFAAPGGLYTVTIRGEPSEGGSVSIQTPCGSFATDNVQPTISIQLAGGTEVDLNATPAKGYRFRGWGDDLSSSQDNVTLTLDSPKTVTANFAKPSPFPWVWVVTGTTALFVAVFAAAMLVGGRAKSRSHSTDVVD